MNNASFTPSAQSELQWSDLVRSVATCGTSDPGPDPSFDHDPIPPEHDEVPCA